MSDFKHLKDWLSNQFESSELYLVHYEKPDGSEADVLVATEFPHYMDNQLHEFTQGEQGGGRVLSYMPIDLEREKDTNLAVQGAQAHSLIISEDLFEGKMGKPLVLNFPDYMATPTDGSIEQRFAEQAYREGKESGIYRFDPEDKPELDQEDIEAIISTYHKEMASNWFKGSEPRNRLARLTPAYDIASIAVAEYFLDNPDFENRYERKINNYSDDLLIFGHSVDAALWKLGIETAVSDVVIDSFQEGVEEHDDKSPLEYIDQEVGINIYPTIGAYESFEQGKLKIENVNSDSINIVPSDKFRDTLSFLNISGSEFAKAVKTAFGGHYNLSGDNADWESIVNKHGSLDKWCPKYDPNSDPLITPIDLFTMMYDMKSNHNDVGALTWSLKTNLKDLLSVPPGESVRLSGGEVSFQLSLGATVDGWTMPVSRQSPPVVLSDVQWSPDEKSPHRAMAHEGKVQWPEAQQKAYYERCHDAFIEDLDASHDLFSRSPNLPVDDEGYTRTSSVRSSSINDRLVDFVNEAKWIYGADTPPHRKLVAIMNDKDKQALGIGPENNYFPSLD